MFRRFLPVVGLASVAAILVAIFPLGGSTPGIKDSAQKITAFYVDNKSKEEAAAFVLMAGCALLVLFAAGLRAALVEAMADSGTLWANAFFGGAILAAAGFATAAGVHLALATAPADLSGPAIQAVNAIDAEDYLGFAVGLGVMMIGAAGALIPAGSPARWLGWIGLAFGLSIFTPAGFIGFLGAMVWLVLAAGTIGRTGPRAAKAPRRAQTAGA